MSLSARYDINGEKARYRQQYTTYKNEIRSCRADIEFQYATFNGDLAIFKMETIKTVSGVAFSMAGLLLSKNLDFKLVADENIDDL